MKKFILLILIIFIKVSIVNAQWQTIFKDSVKYQFHCVHFLNNETGFVGGWNKYDPNDNGIVFRTFDGGLTWDTTHIKEIMLDIQFLNDTLGFAGGDGGEVYATYDGGDNWIYKGGAWFTSDVSSIYFKDSLNGFKLNMLGGLHQTTDGGVNWQLYPNLSLTSYWPGNSRFRFPSPTTGYLIAGGDLSFSSFPPGIAKTTDGANTWDSLTIPANFYPYSAHFFDTLNGFVVGRFGMISTTFDGGQTWSFPYSISQYSLYDIGFVTDSIGYIIGGSNYNDNNNFNGPHRGLIYKTTDKGSTWQMIDSSYSASLNKLQFTSDSIGYVAGQNGEILKITNANTLFTSIQPVFPIDNSFSVYPNPATSHIYITVDKPINISIIDLFGRIILEKKLNDISSKIDISDLSSGIYIIKTGKRVAKFVKN